MSIAKFLSQKLDVSLAFIFLDLYFINMYSLQELSNNYNNIEYDND